MEMQSLFSFVYLDSQERAYTEAKKEEYWQEFFLPVCFVAGYLRVCV